MGYFANNLWPISKHKVDGDLYQIYTEVSQRRGFKKGQCHSPGFEPGSSVYQTDVLTTTPQVLCQESNSNVESWLRSLHYIDHKYWKILIQYTGQKTVSSITPAIQKKSLRGNYREEKKTHGVKSNRCRFMQFWTWTSGVRFSNAQGARAEVGFNKLHQDKRSDTIRVAWATPLIDQPHVQTNHRIPVFWENQFFFIFGGAQ